MVKVVMDAMYAVIFWKMWGFNLVETCISMSVQWPVTTGAIEVKIGATFHQVSMQLFI